MISDLAIGWILFGCLFALGYCRRKKLYGASSIICACLVWPILIGYVIADLTLQGGEKDG